MEEEDWWLPRSQHERRLQEHYILGEVIGRGPGTTVHKILLKGKTELACKVLSKSCLDRKKVVSEVAALPKLRHPHLVQVREVLETPGELLVVEDLVTGGELLERLASSGHYAEKDAAVALRQALLALQHLHQEGRVHGRLKPENMLYHEERLKLADFGISRTHTSHSLLPPEVLACEDWGAASDLWSLGAVLYIMLCGMEPHADHVTFPSPWWDDISLSSKDLIARLLRKHPGERPTAAEVLVHPWVQGETCSRKHMGTTLRRLREFNARRKFRVATHAVLATHRALCLISPDRKVTITDPNGSECVKQLFQHMFPYLAQGIPELGVQPYEPLRVDSLALTKGRGAVTVAGVFRRVVVRGPSNATMTFARLNLGDQEGRLDFGLRLPELHVDADYDLKGHVLVLPLVGNGKATLRLGNASTTVATRLALDKAVGRDVVRVVAMKVDFDVADMDVHLSNLFNGNKVLGQTVNAFLNKNAQEVLADLKEPLGESLSQLFIGLINQIFLNVPLDIWLPNDL